MGMDVHNLEVEIRGTTKPDEIVIIGAHYDNVDDCPAANDNGSGVAATLALARRFAPNLSHPGETPGPPLFVPPARTLRFVLFVNEEPPNFQTEDMGSLVYARACRERGDNIVAMLSLETIGCYSNEPGSQTYPIKPIGWLYPNTGNFIAFVGDYRSRRLVRQAIGTFRQSTQFPSEGAALPGWIAGVGWSDHWAFWQAGYPAVMVTDTAPFRYPHYHKTSDTPEKLDYQQMARVTKGIEAVMRDLVR
jgi:Zn-dependent M28 family amino/carboxypeptidase